MNKNSRIFKDTFPIFQGLHSVQKKPLSLCLFSFFHNMSNFILFSVFAPFSLEFYLNYKVSIKIQGLFRSDCNFQGLSRPCIFIQGLSRTFKVRADPESKMEKKARIQEKSGFFTSTQFTTLHRVSKIYRLYLSLKRNYTR